MDDGLGLPAGARRGRDKGLRAGGRVGEFEGLVVDVEVEGFVVELDVAGDADFSVGRDGERAGGGSLDEELGAADVELGVDVVVCDVLEGEELGSPEVVACWEARWDLDGEETLGVDELLGGPFAGFFVVALVPDLEPAVAGGRVRGHVGDGLDVDCGGAFVEGVDDALLGVVGPFAEFDRDLVAGGGGAGEFHGVLALAAWRGC